MNDQKTIKCSKLTIITAIIAGISLMGFLIMFGLYMRHPSTTTDVSAIVKKCMPSSVIFKTRVMEEVDPAIHGVAKKEMNDSATGFIWSKTPDELLIVTNNHVVKDATQINIRFSVEDAQGLLIPAKTIGKNATSDLAVVSVQKADIPDDIYPQLKPASLGTSDGLKVGQPAIAIGNARGQGQNVTCGIISALNRRVTNVDFGQEVIVADAAINFGNSGSMLLNGEGNVIGINTSKEPEPSEGMAYFIPIDTAVPIVKKIIQQAKK